MVGCLRQVGVDSSFRTALRRDASLLFKLWRNLRVYDGTATVLIHFKQLRCDEVADRMALAAAPVDR